MITKKEFFKLLDADPEARVFRKDVGDGWVGCQYFRLKFLNVNRDKSHHGKPILSCRIHGLMGSFRKDAESKIKADEEKLKLWRQEWQMKTKLHSTTQ